MTPKCRECGRTHTINFDPDHKQDRELLEKISPENPDRAKMRQKLKHPLKEEAEKRKNNVDW